MIFAEEICSRFKGGIADCSLDMPADIRQQMELLIRTIETEAAIYRLEEASLEFLFTIVSNTEALSLQTKEIPLPFDTLFVETKNALAGGATGYYKFGALIRKLKDGIEVFEFFSLDIADIGDCQGLPGSTPYQLQLVQEAMSGPMGFAMTIPTIRTFLATNAEAGEMKVGTTRMGQWAEEKFGIERFTRSFREHAGSTRMVWGPLFLLLAHGGDGTLVERLEDFGKLNVKRAKQGRSPLLTRRIISLGKLGREHMLADVVGHGGDRASPRSHFVRGHFYRHGEKLFWRRPHIRGSGESARMPITTITS